MKKLYLLPLLAIAALTFNSCGNDNEPQGPTYEVFQLGLDDENIDYDANGAWKDLYTPDTRIVADGYVFSHYAGKSFGYDVWYGFAPSKSDDVTDYSSTSFYPGHQLNAITGKGANGAAYMVGYWSSFDEGDKLSLATATLSIKHDDGEVFAPESVKITNTTLAYYSNLNGTNGCKKFDEGDEFVLNIYGEDAHGIQRGPVTVKLASGVNFLKTWQLVDLTPLGEVVGIYFTMNSTDTGKFGINTPTYFALDDLRSVREVIVK